MKVLLSWIRDFVDVPGTAEEIGARLSLRGLALEGIEHVGDDAVLDFDVTANRPDCLSIKGIAREIATVYQLPLKDAPSAASTEGRQTGAVTVSIDDQDLCSRYVATIADVHIGPSPNWMQTRLLASGVRPINNIVDITNYVLIELGYPMHAFDLARLAGSAIVVRRARRGESITTLDGKARTLEPEMLVIADAERAQAIAGVMGGAESEVSDGTTRIVLEAAWFKPQSVRVTSRRLGLRTEASYRFERGADLTATADAMARALALIREINAGVAAGPVIDCYPVPYAARFVTLDTPLLRRFLGMDVPPDETTRILGSLGFEVSRLGGWEAAVPEAPTMTAGLAHAATAWHIGVPGWRVDIHRPIDIVEEVGRHHGFEHLPSTFPAVEAPPHASDPRLTRDSRIRKALLAMGISEAITFAFIDAAAAEPFLAVAELGASETAGAVTLANPLSEKFTTLRPSLLPGLLDAVSHNRRHGRRDVRLFEIGTRFNPRGETRAVGVVWTGTATPLHWSGAAREVDFFDLKGVGEQLCASLHVTGEFTSASRPSFEAGRTADLRVNGQVVGVIGQVSEAVIARRDLPGADAVYALEIDLDALSRQVAPAQRFAKSPPRHPSVVRDLAILIDDTLSAETVRGTIRAAAPATLVDIREFDRYQGKGIADGQVSLALRLTFQASDRTLTDAEVHVAMDHIVSTLKTRLGAVQR